MLGAVRPAVLTWGQAAEFIGIDGPIEARSRSLPEFRFRIGERQWGEVVEGERPRPPISVPDALWESALREFRFPIPAELETAENSRGRPPHSLQT